LRCSHLSNMACVTDSRTKKLNDRVQFCIKMIQSEESDQIDEALEKLELIDMTLDCLTATKCGRVINKLKDDPEVGGRARALVKQWKTVAEAESSNGIHKKSPQQEYSPKSIDEEVKPIKMKTSKRQPSNDFDDFAAQLMEADKHLAPKKKKIKSDVLDADDVQRTLMQGMNKCAVPSSSSAAAYEEFDPSIFKRKERMKVYAGRRKAQTGPSEVPSLLQICQRYLQDHIDQLEELGDAPYGIVACVFERCTTDQLDRISEKNPRLHEDMNPIWERHVKKIFPSAIEKKKRENWYMCYKRLCRERDERLKTISAKINQRAEKAAAPIRRTIMSDVINPVKMQKKQIQNGLRPTFTTADAQELSQARRQIFHSGSKTTLMKLPGGTSSKGSVLASNNRSSKVVAPKRGALMTKTLRMMKGNTRR